MLTKIKPKLLQAKNMEESYKLLQFADDIREELLPDPNEIIMIAKSIKINWRIFNKTKQDSEPRNIKRIRVNIRRKCDKIGRAHV